jgi:uncharacterized OB-fold protein
LFNDERRTTRGKPNNSFPTMHRGEARIEILICQCKLCGKVFFSDVNYIDCGSNDTLHEALRLTIGAGGANNPATR